MKRLLFVLTVMMGVLTIGTFHTKAQSYWKSFKSVKVSYQTSYKGSVPYCDPSEDLWVVNIGKEVQKGVYILLNEDKKNTGCLINLKRSGYSGRWGWLSPKDADSHKTSKQRSLRAKGTFYPGYYDFEMNDND